MMRLAGISILITALAFGLLVGCGQNTSATKTDPSNLVDDNMTATLTEYGYAHFDQLPDLVKKKFPNVTLNNAQPDKQQKVDLTTLTAAGAAPDIIYTHDVYGLNNLQNIGIAADLSPYISKYKVDMSKFDPSALSYLKMVSPAGQITALPWVGSHYILAYNKAVFDKFGISYPKDGMTWQDAIELAKKLTRSADGVQYHGLLMDSYKIISDEYPLLAVDPKTNQSVLTTDSRWTKAFELYQTIYSIPGNFDPKITDNGKAFSNDQNVAMMVTNKSWTNFGQTGQGVNWNMVSVPTLQEFPGQRPAIAAEMFTVSSTSPNKDLAFRIIQYLTQDPTGAGFFASNEAIPPVYNTESFKSILAKNWGYLPADQPNLSAVFYGKAAVWPKNVSPYENLANSILNDAATKIVSGTVDVNTALRNAEDSLNKAIQTAQQQK